MTIEQAPNRIEKLAPDEEKRLRMAWAVLILGVAQQDVAALFSENPARVAEASAAVREAVRK